jgi:hypothetical protein
MLNVSIVLKKHNVTFCGEEVIDFFSIYTIYIFNLYLFIFFIYYLYLIFIFL